MRICSFEGCEKPHEAKGLCSGHYQQVRKGNPLRPLQKPVIGCDFPECEKPHNANGLCSAHDAKRRRGEPHRFDPKFCSFPGCDKKHAAHGLCQAHDVQRRNGNPLIPLRQMNKSGEGRNPERYRLNQRNSSRRRAERKVNAKGFCTSEQLEARIAYYGYHCAYCRGPYEHIDHVIPLSKGGTAWPSNLVPACAPCNMSKRNKNVWEWLEKKIHLV